MSYRTNNPNTRSNRSVPSYPRKRVSRPIHENQTWISAFAGMMSCKENVRSEVPPLLCFVGERKLMNESEVIFSVAMTGMLRIMPAKSK